MDFVWNRAQAEQIRADSERAMRNQARDMRKTATTYRSMANTLDSRATTEQSTASNATKWQQQTDPLTGAQSWDRVPDQSARSQAANRAASLREQVQLLRAEARNLDGAISELERAITSSNTYFNQMLSQVQSIDSSHARTLHSLETDTLNYIREMEQIRDAIPSSLASMATSALLERLRGIEGGRALAALLAAKLAGMPGFCAIFGDPVNMSTGNFLFETTDIEIPGKTPLSFKRFYNALDNLGTSLGKNWTHNFNLTLHTEDNFIHITFSDGHTETFEQISDIEYASALESTNVLVKAKGGFALLDKEGDTYLFCDEGLLRSIEHIDNATTKLSYKDSLLQKVSSLTGHLLFDYNEEGLLSKVTDHTKREVHFSYTNNLLTEVTSPDKSTNTYTYNTQGLLEEMINPLGVVTLKNEFDKESRVIHQILADSSTLTYSYNEQDLTTTITEQNGHQITFVRDSDFKTTEIRYEDGTKESFSYNEFFQRTSFTDRLGHNTSFDYGKNKDLKSVTDALGTTVELEYDSEHSQLSEVKIDGHLKLKNTYNKDAALISLTDALGNSTKFDYEDKINVPKKITLADGSTIKVAYDEAQNPVKIIDPQGNVTESTFDKLNRVIEVIDAENNKTQFEYNEANKVTKITDAAGNSQEYIFNSLGKLTKFVDFDGSIEECLYSDANLPEQITDRLGRVIHIEHDSMQNISKVTSADGAETNFTHNLNNYLEKITKADGSQITFTLDAKGNRTSVTDEEGNTTCLKYDAKDQVTEITDALGNTSKITYSPTGQITEITDALGNTIKREYDKADQLIRETSQLEQSRTYTYTPLGEIETVTDEAGRTTSITYYPGGGKVESITYPDNTKENFTYTPTGKVATHTSREGNVQTLSYDVLGQVVRIDYCNGTNKHFTYDKLGKVTSVTDEAGNTTCYKHTLFGELSQVKDASGNITSYLYNSQDKLIAVIASGKTEIDPDVSLEEVRALVKDNADIRVTEYKRDILGQVTEIIDALGNSEHFTYDLKGQVVEKTDKDRHTTKNAHTPLGDIKHILYSDGREVSLSYNALRQLNQVSDWLGTTTIKLDALGRATSVTDHNNKTINYTWTVLGQRESITYPDGTCAKSHFDELHRLTKITDGTTTVDYIYDELSRLAEKSFSDGKKQTQSFNVLGQLASLKTFAGSELLDSFDIGYDVLGNKAQIVQSRKDLPEQSGTYSFTHDSLQRLEQVTKDGKLLRAYGYDPYHNRVSLSDESGTTTSSFNALNQLISSVDSTGIETSYVYDLRGNQIEKYLDEKLISKHHFGALNRLEEAQNFSTEQSAVYTYSGLGHRVAKTIADLEPTLPNANPTKHMEDTLDLTRQYNNLLQRNEDGASVSFIWDSALLTANSSNNTDTYLLDYLGSPLRAGDSAFAFDEFGQTLVGNFNFQTFGYTGYQQDNVADTWFAQARHYDPATGRFGAEDVIKGHTAAPQSLNVYSYCLNRPLEFVDLDGRTPALPESARNIMSNIGSWMADVATVQVVDEEPFSPNVVHQTSAYAGNNDILTASIITNTVANTQNVGIQLNSPTITIPSTSTAPVFHVGLSTDGKAFVGIGTKDVNTSTTSVYSLLASMDGVSASTSGGYLDDEGNKSVTKWTSDPVEWWKVALVYVAVKVVVAIVALVAIFAPALVAALKNAGGVAGIGLVLKNIFGGTVVGGGFSASKLLGTVMSFPAFQRGLPVLLELLMGLRFRFANEVSCDRQT